MATRTWLDQNANWNDTSNWSGATVPTGTDTVLILRGSQNIQTNLNQAAVTPTLVSVGREFRGSIGSPGNPLIFGNTTALRINAPSAKALCFSFSGATLADAYIEATNSFPYSFYFGAGTCTQMSVGDCGRMYLGGGTVTRMNFDPFSPSAYCYSEAGLVLTNCYQGGGRIDSDCIVATNLEVFGGTFDFLGSAGGTMPLVSVFPNSTFIWRSPGSVITALYVKNGTVDGSVEDSVKTLTNAECHGQQGVINLNNALRNFTVSNNIKRFGGQIYGTNAVTDYAIGGQGVVIGGR